MRTLYINSLTKEELKTYRILRFHPIKKTGNRYYYRSMSQFRWLPVKSSVARKIVEFKMQAASKQLADFLKKGKFSSVEELKNVVENILEISCDNYEYAESVILEAVKKVK